MNLSFTNMQQLYIYVFFTAIDDRQSQLLDDTAMYDTGRRSALPAPMSTGDVGLFSLLTKNIGKDLTRISMPVTLNEPLNTLQVIDVICYFRLGRITLNGNWKEAQVNSHVYNKD